MAYIFFIFIICIHATPKKQVHFKCTCARIEVGYCLIFHLLTKIGECFGKFVNLLPHPIDYFCLRFHCPSLSLTSLTQHGQSFGEGIFLFKRIDNCGCGGASEFLNLFLSILCT